MSKSDLFSIISLPESGIAAAEQVLFELECQPSRYTEILIGFHNPAKWTRLRTVWIFVHLNDPSVKKDERVVKELIRIASSEIDPLIRGNALKALLSFPLKKSQIKGLIDTAWEMLEMKDSRVCNVWALEALFSWREMFPGIAEKIKKKLQEFTATGPPSLMSRARLLVKRSIVNALPGRGARKK